MADKALSIKALSMERKAVDWFGASKLMVQNVAPATAIIAIERTRMLEKV